MNDPELKEMIHKVIFAVAVAVVFAVIGKLNNSAEKHFPSVDAVADCSCSFCRSSTVLRGHIRQQRNPFFFCQPVVCLQPCEQRLFGILHDFSLKNQQGGLA